MQLKIQNFKFTNMQRHPENRKPKSAKMVSLTQ